MTLSVSHEALVFLYACLAGALIFLLYDLFRLIRQKTGGGILMVHVQDCLFWLLALGILFFAILTVNGGIVRFYEIFGAALGALLYGLTLSPFVLRLMGRILAFFSKIFKIFSKILLTPLLFAYNIMYRCLSVVFTPVYRLFKRLFKRVLDGGGRCCRFIKKQ